MRRGGRPPYQRNRLGQKWRVHQHAIRNPRRDAGDLTTRDFHPLCRAHVSWFAQGMVADLPAQLVTFTNSVLLSRIEPSMARSAMSYGTANACTPPL
jgi:hypothetical protein